MRCAICSRRHPALILTSICSAALLLQTPFAAATVIQWNGTGGGEVDSDDYNSIFQIPANTNSAVDWSSFLSWTPGQIPGSNDDVSFLNTDYSQNLRSQVDRTIKSLIIFTNSSFSIDFGTANGNEFRNLILSTGGLYQTSTGTQNFFGSIVNSTSAQWSIDGGGQFNVYGPVSTVGSFTKNGNGTLVLKNNFQSTGATAAFDGNLSIGNNAFSTSYIYVGNDTTGDNATLDISELSSGTRQLSPIQINTAGILVLRGAQHASYLKANLTLAEAPYVPPTLDVTGNTTVDEFDITGTGSDLNGLQLNGPGTLTVSKFDTNAYSTLDLNSASLFIQAQSPQTFQGRMFCTNSSLETSGTVTIADFVMHDGGSVKIDSGSFEIDEAETDKVQLGGAGNLILNGSGNLTLTNGTSSSIFSGNMTVQAGTLQLNNFLPSLDILPYGGTVTVTAGTLQLNNTAEHNVVAGTVKVGAANDTTSGPTVTWLASDQLADSTTINFLSGTIDLNGQNETISGINGSGTGAMNVKIGAGTLTLSGDSVASAGAKVSANGNVDLNGGTRGFDADGSSSLNSNFTNWIFAGQINNGTFNKTGVGRVEFNGVIGNAVINVGAGSARITASSTFGGLTGTGGVEINAPLAINLPTGSENFSGSLSGTSLLTLSGAGKLILDTANPNYQGQVTIHSGATLALQNTSGSATGTGPVLIDGGTLAGSGHIAPSAANTIELRSGIIAPGSASARTLNFDLTSNQGVFDKFNLTGGTLQLDFGTSSDSIAFGSLGQWLTGTGASLEIDQGAGFSTSATYTIFSNVQNSGAGFAFANIAGGPAGYLPNVYFDSPTNSYKLQFISEALPGDYNNNGVVDEADYVVWRDNQNTNHLLPNDPLGGTIGAAQYNQWRSHFGQSLQNGASLNASGSVPEPSSFVLLSIAIIFFRFSPARVARGQAP